MTPAEQLSSLDLKVYSAAWCPDCKRLDQWLAQERIAHTKVDIESDPTAADKLETETGKRAIPFILVNDAHWVRGYHRELPQRLDTELLIRELLAHA
jgi:mycoredoxin